MKVILMVFLKKPYLGKWLFMDPKMIRPNNFGSTLTIFLQILHNNRGQEVHGSYINGLKCSYLQFHTLYDRICEVTTDFCSINLVEEKQTRH